MLRLSTCREKINSMNLLMYMAPIAVLLLVPATIFMEDNVVAITIQLAKKDINIIWYLLFNSSLAYFVNLTNFLVTKHTSALTLQVCMPCFPPCPGFLVSEETHDTLMLRASMILLVSAGPGQRKRSRCSCDLHLDIQEPGVNNWDAGLHPDRHRGASLQ